MKEILELRINYQYANLLFEPYEGRNLGTSVRVVEISREDIRYSQIPIVAAEVYKKTGKKFFFGWKIKRRAIYRNERAKGNYFDFADWARDNIDEGRQNLTGTHGENFAFDVGGALVKGGMWVEYSIGESDGKGGMREVYGSVIVFEETGGTRFEPDQVPMYGARTHSEIIRKALGHILPKEYIDFIIKGSRKADRIWYQIKKYSYMHAMTRKGQSVSEAMSKAKDYIHRKMNTFASEMDANNLERAFIALGMAMHPLMDQHSPFHNWTEWRPFSISALVHTFGEIGNTTGSDKAIDDVREFYNYVIWTYLESR